MSLSLHEVLEQLDAAAKAGVEWQSFYKHELRDELLQSLKLMKYQVALHGTEVFTVSSVPLVEYSFRSDNACTSKRNK